MRRGSSKAGLIIGSILVITLLFNSVVYACSKAGMVMAMHGMSMAMADGMGEKSVERGPCAQHKQDICKSVRDRLLSIQSSPSKAGDYQPLVLLTLPLNVDIDIPDHTRSLPASPEWAIAYHSVFKLPLPLSFSVLRI